MRYLLAGVVTYAALVLAAAPQQADPQAGLKDVADGLRALATKMESIRIAPGSTLAQELKPVTVLRGNTGPFPVVPGAPQQKMVQLKAPFDGWLLGWQPWLGFDRGSEVEAGFGLWHGDEELVVMSPHKENGSVYYDSATPPYCFPQGYARRVKKDDIVTLVCFVANTGAAPTNAHGMARVYFGQ